VVVLASLFGGEVGHDLVVVSLSPFARGFTKEILTSFSSIRMGLMKSKPQRTLPLNDILTGDGVSTLAPFACVVVLALPKLPIEVMVVVLRLRPMDVYEVTTKKTCQNLFFCTFRYPCLIISDFQVVCRT
jgi:hypothetical protein